MIPIHWVSAYLDSSGYAEATRNYITCLIKSGKVDISCEHVSFEHEKTSHQLVNEVIAPHIKPDTGKPIRVVHLTPENYPRTRRQGAYNIGYVAWETTKIPDHWVGLCDQMDELWTPSEWCVKVFKKALPHKPVFCIPHGLNLPDQKAIALLPDNPPMIMDKFKDTYKFYFIGQWMQRKSPKSLLIAYYTEFQGGENVSLCLKTYRRNTTPPEQQAIKADIIKIKQSLKMPTYPAVLFFGHLFTSQEMQQLHHKCDCFVLPSASEGWGLTQAEAMTHGNPVISTNRSGLADFLTNKNSLPVKSIETPVHNMEWMGPYHGGMNWYEPDIMDIRKQMRWAYENQEAARAIGQRGKKTIEKSFNWDVISARIVSRLEEIMKEKGL